MSSSTSRSENTSSTVAIVNTDDPHIKVLLTLEHYTLSELGLKTTDDSR